MTIISYLETENTGELIGPKLILKMWQTVLRVEPDKKNKGVVRLKGFNPL